MRHLRARPMTFPIIALAAVGAIAIVVIVVLGVIYWPTREELDAWRRNRR